MSPWKIAGDVPETPTTDTNFVAPDRFQGQDEPEPVSEEKPEESALVEEKVETQPEGQPAEEVVETEIPPEARSDKAVNRFQELANENKLLREQIGLLINRAVPPHQPDKPPPSVEFDPDSIDDEDKLKAYLKSLHSKLDANERRLAEIDAFRSEVRRESFDSDVKRNLSEAFVKNPDAVQFESEIADAIDKQVARDKAQHERFGNLPYDATRYHELAKTKAAQYQGIINKYKVPIGTRQAAADKVKANQGLPRPIPQGTQSATVGKMPRGIDAAIDSWIAETQQGFKQ